MQTIAEIFGWIVANYDTVLNAIAAILAGVIGISLLIPGDQPEKALQGVVDFIAKFSKKKKE